MGVVEVGVVVYLGVLGLIAFNSHRKSAQIIKK